MRFIKPILIGFAGLFAVITIISLLMPSQVTLVRSVTIRADRDSISRQVSDIGNWKNWHPGINGNCREVPASPGNADCNIAGREYSIMRSVDTAGIFHFILNTPGQSVIHYRFYLTQPQAEDGTELHWQVQTRLKWYPWEKFSGIFFSESAGPGYEQALQSLKEYCEKKKRPL